MLNEPEKSFYISPFHRWYSQCWHYSGIVVFYWSSWRQMIKTESVFDLDDAERVNNIPNFSHLW